MARKVEITARKTGGGTTVWSTPKDIEALIASGIGRPITFIRETACDVIDDISKSKIISLSVDLGNGPLLIAAKEYMLRGGISLLKNLFRHSKAYVEFAALLNLSALDVPVPKPLAAVEVRCFRFLTKSYLFSEEIVGAENLLNLLDAKKNQELGRAQVNRVIKALADTLARAHARGLYHGDLNASHLIVNDANTENPKVYLIDFENSRIRVGKDGKPKEISLEERVKDIARLERSASYFLSAKERLRFLKYYTAQAGLGTGIEELRSRVSALAARRAR